MTEETLHKANSIRQKIRNIEDVLNSFYWDKEQVFSKKKNLF